MGANKSFQKFEVGQLVRFKDRRYRIQSFISTDSVLAINVDTSESERLRLESVVPVASDDTPVDGARMLRDLTAYTETEWATAQRRLEIIRPLFETPRQTRKELEAHAKLHDIHVSTLYSWLKLYRQAGQVSALVPAKPGRKPGTTLLDSLQETIIESAIADIYLTKERGIAEDVVKEVTMRCRLAKVAPPSANSVRSRIALLDPAVALRKRGLDDQAKVYEAIRGNFPGADVPLSVVQIDHTPGDITLVDEAHRLPIGKPWITLAIDVCTRMIVGVYVSLEAPNAAAVGLCLSRAMCPKQEYLLSLGVEGDWPVWGKMRTVHADNGKDFRCEAVTRACQEYDIDVQWRPVTKPHYGGHIERLMGTASKELHKLPGTTFSNPKERGKYKSEERAVLTFKEFETHLVDFVVNRYHPDLHTGIGMSPRRKWDLGLLGDGKTPGTGLFPVPMDPIRVQLDFMPFELRTVQRYGVQIDNIGYYDPVLDPYIHAEDPDITSAKRKFLFRRDPRDISKVYFLDPKSQDYAEIPYRNIGHPAISVWELREVQRHFREQGISDVDEERIFQALLRMRRRVDDATAKTKAARRMATRRPAEKPAKPPVAPSKPNRKTGSPLEAPSAQADQDPFSTPILPFDEVSLQR